MNAEQHTNRRRSPRRAVRMPCQAVRERDFTLLGEVIADLSPEGMLLHTTSRAYTGDEVIVSFFEPGDGRWYDLSATVARVIHGRRGGDESRALALEFEGMSREDYESLVETLKGRPPRFPLRGARARSRHAGTA